MRTIKYICIFYYKYNLCTSTKYYPHNIFLGTYNPENVVVRLISPTSIRVSWRPPEDVGNEISRYTIVVSSTNDGKIGETIVEVDNPVKNHYIHEIQNLPARKKLIVTVQATRKGYQSDSIKREISTYEESKYSQTCIKRSPLGQRKSGHLRHVTSEKMFISYEIFYERARKM